jgi:hypothetical protein
MKWPLLLNRATYGVSWKLCLVLVMGSLNLSRAEDSALSSTKTLKVATYNASLFGKTAGAVANRLQGGKDRQARSIASIIQTVRPDLLIINEVDHDEDALTVKLLRDQYLSVGQNDLEGIDFPYVYSAPSNTGVDSQQDLNRNGRLGDPEDAWGYGVYPGQYAFAVLSRFPIAEESIRTFQKFAWSQLPGALRPIHPQSSVPYYSDEVWKSLRLSSKNHVDVPVQIADKTIHLLVSHPTPPVFDGPEDHNGCRNHDEISFWKHYLEGSSKLIDDAGQAGGLDPNASFVILGDLNSDPKDGGSRQAAIQSLLGHPRVKDPLPRRSSATDTTPASEATDTADFGKVGEVRVDYVLPSANFTVKQSGVFWPANKAAGSEWIHASDHRLVWVELNL